jgi:hypothetical protein
MELIALEISPHLLGALVFMLCDEAVSEILGF